MADRADPFFIYPAEASGHVDSEAFVLLHKAKPRWLVANPTALEIARSLNAGQTVEAIADRLVSSYGIASQVATRDVRQVAEQLSIEGFLGPVHHEQQGRVPSLQSAYFHVTNRCNLRCLHCYYPSRAGPADMPADLICRLIDEVAAQGGTGITLSGGEALLHPEIKRILGHASSKLSVRLLTNGTLIDQEWASLLVDLGAQVQVSIDGSTEQIHDRIRGKGTFKRALRAVSFLQEAGLGDNLALCATVMEQNLPDLSRIIGLAEELEVPVVRFLPLSRRGRAAALWDEIGAGVSIRDQEKFYDHAGDLQSTRALSVEVSCGLSGFLLDLPDSCPADGIWCSVGQQLVVDVDGSIFPCVLLMQDTFRLGSVYHDCLVDTIRSQGMSEVCRILVDRRSRIAECRACQWRSFCQAGCMGQALDNEGSVWDTDFFCAYRKRAYSRAFQRILKHEAERARA